MSTKKLDVECWLHPGKLGAKAPTLCLYHAAPEVGAEIKDALEGLQNDARQSERSFQLASCERHRAMVQLVVRLVSPREVLQVMHVGCDREIATIEVTEMGLALLIDAWANWLAGAEDFGVSPAHSRLKTRQLGARDRESLEVWFWGPYYYAP